MPQPEISGVAIVINLVFVVITFILGFCSALFFFILKRIKKNIDDLWSKRNKDHDDLTRIKSKLKID